MAPEHLEALLAASAALGQRRERLAALAADPGALRDEVEGLGDEIERLAELVGAIRLTPVDEVFMRFPRMVRDLAQSLGKLLELHVDGGGIAIGRGVADALGDPIMHALRNAIDHGIEFPGDRVAAGKDPIGSLTLAARRTADAIEIEVRDDGRGMDPQALRASAVRAGRMDVGSALALTDEEAPPARVPARPLHRARRHRGLGARGRDGRGARRGAGARGRGRHREHPGNGQRGHDPAPPRSTFRLLLTK